VFNIDNPQHVFTYYSSSNSYRYTLGNADIEYMPLEVFAKAFDMHRNEWTIGYNENSDPIFYKKIENVVNKKGTFVELYSGLEEFLKSNGLCMDNVFINSIALPALTINSMTIIIHVPDRTDAIVTISKVV
jgi:hypothetical protein